jgi:hypothetical protein
VAALAEAQQRTDAQVAALVAAQQRTEEALARLAERVERLTNVTGNMRGEVLELRYYNRVGAYFGRLLRRARVVEWPSIEDDLAARLTPDQLDDLLLVDLIVTGMPRRVPDAAPVWLAVEVSATVDRDDVARAHRRAVFLAQAGFRAVPVAAGEAATEGAYTLAQAQQVTLLQDGRALNWEAALAAWSGGPPPAGE